MGLFGALFGSDEPASEPFAMKIEDVFSVTGRDVVVTGKVALGAVRKGAALVLHRPGWSKPCRLTKIEKLSQEAERAVLGENVALVLSGVEKDEVRSGDDLRDR